MVRLQHVYKTFEGPIHALRNIQFQIERGEFVFLTGPSGSGKTTLFRLLCAFDTPTSGSLNVAGYDLTQIPSGSIPSLRRRIGVVFQDFRLLSGRTVFENVALPLVVQNENPNLIRDRVDEVLQRVGLRFKPDQSVDQLSGGEKQRVAVARALVHRPALLIADEPTGNLDPDLSREIISLFENVNGQGTTILVATHDYTLLDVFKKRRLHLEHGMLEEKGSPL